LTIGCIDPAADRLDAGIPGGQRRAAIEPEHHASMSPLQVIRGFADRRLRM